MEPFDHFSIEKQAALASLAALRGILAELDGMGVEVEDDLAKIAKAVAAVQSDVLRIALLGAFSDGKTSVAAAWLGQVTGNMKIDPDESSDEVLTYQPEGLEGRCKIVDTPGLFGDKEKTDDGHQVKLDDLTRRYISEAHLLFYVVDSTNPLKDSHGKIARWVLRDLDKLATTIFVINKMDAVADLSDAAQFEAQATIKKRNLIDKLRRIADLDDNEVARLRIVCMSSDPGGRGLDFWFARRELYASRSRIGELKDATQRILDDSVPAYLIAKTGLDVVRDLVIRKVEIARKEAERLKTFGEQNTEEAKRMAEDIKRGKSEINRLAAQLFEQLTAMEAQLRAKLRPLSMAELRPFLEDEIGFDDKEVGFKLQLRIKFAIDQFFEQSTVVADRVANELEKHLESGVTFMDAFGSDAARAASGALKKLSTLDPATIKQAIFVARDLLKELTGVAVKFKPWEASKLAGNIGKWAGPVGALITIGTDIHAAYDASKREQALKESRTAIEGMIGEMFKGIYDLLRDDKKMFAAFAPQFAGFESVLAEMNMATDRINANRMTLDRIGSQLVALALPSPHRPGELAPK